MSDDIRVLLVEVQGRGGFWHYTHALSAALTQQGAVTALVTTPGYEAVGNHTAPVFVLGRRRPLWGPAVLRRAWSQGIRFLALSRILNEFRPHVVHLQGPLGQADFLFYRWFKRHGARVVYTAHNPRPRRGRSGRLGEARYRAADALVALSRLGVAHLIADGHEPAKVHFIPHGNYLHLCDQSSLPPSQARGALGLPDSARVVLFFGQIAPYKGLDLLIDAFARVRREDRHAYLIIAGPAAESLEPYRNLLDRYELAPAVMLHPEYVPLSELSRYFLAADVVAFPYRQSYQSGALQLAYGFGRPVVVTVTSDLGADVEEDGAGIVADPDPGDFAAALLEVLSDPVRASQMGRAARQAAETKYAWEQVAARSLRVYRHICGLAAAPGDAGAGIVEETGPGESSTPDPRGRPAKVS